MKTVISKAEKEIIKNAKKTALRDGYPQIIYLQNEKYSKDITEDERYSFSRLFGKLSLFNSDESLIIGIVDTFYSNGCRNVEYISMAKSPFRVKEYIKRYEVTF